jgi:peptide/nickel transport system substrate-binding protein
MRRLHKIKLRGFSIAAISALLALLIVACGSAAAPTTAPTDGETETGEVATQAPQEAEVEATTEETDTTATTPTAVPSPAEGGEAVQTVDNFTIMVTSQGNEIFNHKYSQGENNLWKRLSEVWLLGGSFKDGRLQLDPETGIANHWEISEDGHSWDFTIRDDVKFHNGSDLTIDDVAFSFDWGISEEAVGVSTVRVARQITDREVTGPNTFRLTTENPLGNLGVALSEIDNTTLGTVLSQDYWMSLPEGQEVDNCTPVEHCIRASEFEKNPSPGLPGPYQVVAHRPSEEFVYERFEDYYLKEQRPYPFQQISLRLVPELSTRVAALRGGGADIIEADLRVLDQIRESEGNVVFAREAVHIWINASNCDQAVDAQGNPIMCHDKNVRYALDYAIDKTKVQELYGGEEVFEIAGYQGIASPSGLGYEEDIAPLPFDPEKAQQLLADAGYPGGEGFNGGRVFPIHTWVGAGAPLTVELSELLCNMWETNLGINCEVNVTEEVSHKNKQYAGELPGEYVVRTNENTFDGGRRLLGRYGPDGYIAKDAEMTENDILPALATVGTQQERHEAYHTALKTIFDKHYDFSPGYLNQPYGVSARVASWEPWPLSPYPSALWSIQIAQ